MNILYLAHRIPYPPDKGDKIRAFHQIKFFAQRHELDVCSLVDDPRDKKYIEPLRNMCRTLKIAEIPARWKKLFSLRSVFSSRTTCTELYFYSQKLQKEIDELIRNTKYDLIFLYCSSMSAYVRKIEHIPVVIDFVDIDSDKWMQYAKYAPLPLNILYSMEGKKLAQLEKNILKKVKAGFLVTEKETEFFSGFDGGNAVHAVANGIDISFFDVKKTPERPELQKEFYISFTGAMDYFPNEDGVVYFCEQVFPLIRAKIPDIKFYIIGRNPTPRVEKLAQDPHVIVTGGVDDVRPYLRYSQLGVIPLRMARGIQNKILEAIAMGLAVVATSNAFEGLSLIPGRDIIVADDLQKIADGVIDLLKNKSKRDAIQKSAQKILREKYDWTTNLIRMETILQEVVKNKNAEGGI